MNTSRMIRIFVSSVFEGFEDDRNILNELAYGELEEYCAEHDFSFQVIDLRWGISDSLAGLYQTQRLCLQEIERCRKQSPKPNFLILSGERYGWIPLPDVIRKEDYEVISSHCNSEQKALIDSFYFLDLNDAQQRYHHQNSKLNEKLAKKTLFAIARKWLPKEQLGCFGVSMTEQEIRQGLFDIEDACSHAVVCIREKGDGMAVADEKAVALNKRLRHELKDYPGHLIEYTRPDPVFASKAKEALLAIIKDRIEEVTAQEAMRPAEERQRENTWDSLNAAAQEYIDAKDLFSCLHEQTIRNPGKIIVAMGEQGAGKTLLLKTFAARTKSFCVFTDLHRDAGTIAGIAGRILQQASLSIPREPYEAGIQYLSKCLQALPGNSIVVIDSFDELNEEKHLLLTMEIPGNVTIVIGSTPMEIPDACIPFHVNTLSQSDAIGMLAVMMVKRGRTLQQTQWETVRKGLPETVTALYLFELADKLYSVKGDEVISFDFDKSTYDMIKTTYDKRLKYYHGDFAKRAYAAISHSKHGLLESELIAILSQDEQIQAVVDKLNKAHHHTSTGYALPISNLWSQLLNVSGDFLVQHNEDNKSLLRFRHGIMLSMAHAGCDDSLADHMIRYFEQLPDHNTRKIDELLQLYKGKDERLAKEYLSHPATQDAWIRARRYDNLLEEMSSLQLDIAVAGNHSFLFRRYPDAYPYVYNRLEDKHVFSVPYLSGEHARNAGEGFRPLAFTGEIALHHDRVIAVSTPSAIILYDYGRSLVTDTYLFERESYVALYWKEEKLILRQKQSRISFTIKDGRITRQDTETCAPMGDLFDDDEYMEKAGGYMERDYKATYSNNLSFHFNDKKENTSLYYLGSKTSVKVWKHMACAIINNSLIHVINLKEQKIWIEIQGNDFTGAVFADDGNSILIIRKDGFIQVMDIANKENRNMVVPREKSWRMQELQEITKNKFSESIDSLLHMFTDSFTQDQYCHARLQSTDMTSPLFTCYSKKHDVYACYYNPAGMAYIRLFSNKNNTLLAERIVRPILECDLTGDPFQLDEDSIVICSGQAAQRINIFTCEITKTPAPLDDYSQYRDQPQLTKTLRPKNPRIANILSTIFLFGMINTIRRIVDSTNISSFEHVCVKHGIKYTFVVNISRQTIHVIHNGNVIIRDQLEYPFLAVDVLGDTLYVLKEYGEEPMEYNVRT